MKKDGMMTSLTRPQDEMVNAMTHAVGFVLSLLAAACLLERVHHQSIARIVACTIYAATLVLVFGVSTLSHLFYDLNWRRRFRTLDQAVIFLLIAGTYTPLAAVYLSEGWWLGILVAMWILAFIGIFRVAQVRDLSRKDKALFGLMGFVPSVTLIKLSQVAPSEVIIGIIIGGACYCVGAIFLRFSAAVRYMHAVWHTFVLAGSGFHYWSILIAISVHSGNDLQ